MTLMIDMSRAAAAAEAPNRASYAAYVEAQAKLLEPVVRAAALVLLARLRDPSEAMCEAGSYADTSSGLWLAMLDAFAEENGLGPSA